ncbi:MAG: hypothetical protein ACTSVU_02755 [Promethearchaeota archaeon]
MYPIIIEGIIFIGIAIFTLYFLSVMAEQRKILNTQITVCHDLIREGYFNIAYARLRAIKTSPLQFWFKSSYKKIKNMLETCIHNIFILKQKDEIWELAQQKPKDAYNQLTGMVYALSDRTLDYRITDYSLNEMKIMLKRIQMFF